MDIQFVLDPGRMNALNDYTRQSVLQCTEVFGIALDMLVDMVVSAMSCHDYSEKDFTDAFKGLSAEEISSEMHNMFYSQLDNLIDQMTDDLHPATLPEDAIISKYTSICYSVAGAFLEEIREILQKYFPHQVCFFKRYAVYDAAKLRYGGPYVITAKVGVFPSTMHYDRPPLGHQHHRKLSDY